MESGAKLNFTFLPPLKSCQFKRESLSLMGPKKASQGPAVDGHTIGQSSCSQTEGDGGAKETGKIFKNFPQIIVPWSGSDRVPLCVYGAMEARNFELTMLSMYLFSMVLLLTF